MSWHYKKVGSPLELATDIANADLASEAKAQLLAAVNAVCVPNWEGGAIVVAESSGHVDTCGGQATMRIEILQKAPPLPAPEPAPAPESPGAPDTPAADSAPKN